MARIYEQQNVKPAQNKKTGPTEKKETAKKVDKGEEKKEEGEGA